MSDDLQAAFKALTRLVDQAMNTAGSDEGAARAHADGVTVHCALVLATPDHLDCTRPDCTETVAPTAAKCGEGHPQARRDGAADHSACHPGWECAECKPPTPAEPARESDGVGLREGLAQVLAEHEERRAVGGSGPDFRVWAFCSCDPDHEIHGADMPMTILEHRNEFEDAVRRAYRAHLADVLVASDWPDAAAPNPRDARVAAEPQRAKEKS